MSDWQPIETAPKDGSKIDLWVVFVDGKGRRCPDCSWCEQHTWSGAPGPYGWCEWSDKLDASIGVEEEERILTDGRKYGYRATHWMAIPEPPPEIIVNPGVDFRNDL